MSRRSAVCAFAVATLLPVASASAQQAERFIAAMRRVAPDAPSFLSIDMRAQSALSSARGGARAAALRLDAASPSVRWRGAEWRLHGAWLHGMTAVDSSPQVIDVAATSRWRAAGLPMRFEAGFRALDASATGARLLAALEPLRVAPRLRVSAAFELFDGDARLASAGPGLGQDTGIVFPDTAQGPVDGNDLRTSRSLYAVSSVALGTSWRGVDLDLRAWQRMPLGISSRRQLAPRLETSIEANVPLSRRTALVGMIADRSYGGEAPGPHLAIGLRWSTGRRIPPAVRRAPRLARCTDSGATGVRLRVHAPGARVVEIEGDPTGWSPRALAPSAPVGWWEMRVAEAAGVQRVRVRIDGGAWIAPAGHPTERSEFGGEVAVLRATTSACVGD